MLTLATLLLSQVTVTLPAEATVRGSEITLGEIATVTGPDEEEVTKVRSVELGYAPSPGFTRVLESWKIEARLERQLAGMEIDLQGEASCRLWPAVAVVRSQELVTVARAALEEVFAQEDATIETVGEVDDQTVPEGSLGRELLAQPDTSASTSESLQPGTWNVPVQILVDGMPYRTVWTSFRVTLHRDLPVLTRDIPRGGSIQPGDLVLERTAIARSGAFQPLGERKLVGAVAKHPLRRGHPVTASDVRRPLAVAEGETAHLVVESGTIHVTARVTALEDGYLDDVISVVVVGTEKELSARITQRGRLLLDLGTPAPANLVSNSIR